MTLESKGNNRKVVLCGNWKMYKNIAEAKDFIQNLAPLLKESQAAIYLAVPFTAIAECAALVKTLQTSLVIGAQNMNSADEGAFTGEIAGQMLTEAGAQFVILGHSERRRLFQESCESVHKKVVRALKDELQPIVCIGETLEQRESGQTREVLKKQILSSLKDLIPSQFQKIILAYEPVWAIGTGRVATPQEAEETHLFCREIISQQWGAAVADCLSIQYGGSVNSENAAQLTQQPNIDGLLIGGASLSVDSFYKIIQATLYQDSP